jgi:heme/copper-type cytochrome/quinol oxidase subunit 3
MLFSALFGRSFPSYKPRSIIFARLLLALAMVDTIHLLSSSLTFSIPHLSTSYSNQEWMYLVPYTLPLAQVDTAVFF